MLAKHALSQLSYGPFVVCAPSGARTLASARRRLRGWQSLAALHANARQSKRRESAAVIRLPTADSRLPIMVGLGGLEPPTSRLSSARSNQLSYKPELSSAHKSSPPSMISGGKRDEDGGVPPMRPLTKPLIPSRPIKRPNESQSFLAPGSRPRRQTLDKGLP